MKHYEDPKWAQSMQLSLDHNYAMAEFLGESGLTDSDLQGLAPRLKAFHQSLASQREAGQLGFMELPYQTQVVKEVRQVAKPLLGVVLGCGGAGNRGLRPGSPGPASGLVPPPTQQVPHGPPPPEARTLGCRQR